LSECGVNPAGQHHDAGTHRIDLALGGSGGSGRGASNTSGATAAGGGCQPGAGAGQEDRGSEAQTPGDDATGCS
ncbi:MAG: hypothetical protein V7634_2184, partial [Bradyrhizobium sp.]